MKIPKTIKIGCHRVDIKYPYVFTERYDRYAQFDSAQMHIMLGAVNNSGEKRPKESILVTLIHELMHAIEHISGHNVFKNMGDNEEAAIDGFANVIAQILIDNNFIEWLESDFIEDEQEEF